MIIYISLTRRELEVINRQNLKYPLAIAEKAYQDAILANWEIAKQEKIGESQKIFYSEAVDDLAIEDMIRRLDIGVIGKRD